MASPAVHPLSGGRPCASQHLAGKLTSLLVVTALALLGLAVPALTTPTARAAEGVVTSGEVSLFSLAEADDGAVPYVLELGVDGASADPGKTSVGVPDSRLSQVTDPALVKAGAVSGYLVPAKGSPLRLGWDAAQLALDDNGYLGARVSLSWTGPEGAQVFVARSGPQDQAVSLQPSGSFEVLPAPKDASRTAEAGTELVFGQVSHLAEEAAAPLKDAATWLFTKPGTYLLTATAVASNPTQSQESPCTEPVTYTVKVGDAAIAGQVPAAPAPGDSPAPGDTGSSDKEAEGQDGAAGLSLDIPETIAPGGSLDPWASGFPEGALVEFVLDGQVIGSVVSEHDDAVLGYKLPDTTGPGEHRLTARSGALSITKSFTVAGKPAAPGPSKPAPPTARPTPPASKPVPPVTKPAPPTARPTPPASKPVPPVTKPAPPTAKPTPPASKPVPPASNSAAPADTCTAPAGTEVTLDSGHVDLFHLASEPDGRLSLHLREDVTGSGVLHEPEKALLKVKEAAKAPVKETVAAGEWAVPSAVAKQLGLSETSVYYLPEAQNQERALLWPGWDVLAARPGGYESATFDVSFKGPEGGRIFTFNAGTFGGLTSTLKDGSWEIHASGSTIDQPYLAHKHVNWLFTKAGRYQLSVTAHARKGDGTVRSLPARTYTIDVGDSCATGHQPGARKQSQQPGGGTQPPGGNGGQDQDGSKALNVNDGGQAGLLGGTGGSGLGGSGSYGGASGGSGRSGGPAAEVCVPTEITREATEEEAKKLASGGASATSKGASSGSANKATTTLSFSVGPGASGNATDGHFDLGPAIENGTLYARVKDDRNQPASWVDPATLTFALGDKAALKAPKDLSFVATEGKEVWMVPSTQVAGVPWLGMNSQRQEIVSGTTGEVVFTLEAVNGPGKVAVFSAGGLGSGVGAHVFDGAGSSYTLPKNTHAHQNWVFTEPGSYQLTISMTVKPTSGELKGSGGAGAAATASTGPALKVVPGEKGKNGRPMVKATVGRTPSGAECDLAAAAKAGRLARTGTDTYSLLGLTSLLLVSGAVVAAASQRRRRARA